MCKEWSLIATDALIWSHAPESTTWIQWKMYQCQLVYFSFQKLWCSSHYHVVCPRNKTKKIETIALPYTLTQTTCSLEFQIQSTMGKGDLSGRWAGGEEVLDCFFFFFYQNYFFGTKSENIWERFQIWYFPLIIRGKQLGKDEKNQKERGYTSWVQTLCNTVV